jgi:hypothetical protein
LSNFEFFPREIENLNKKCELYFLPKIKPNLLKEINKNPA